MRTLVETGALAGDRGAYRLAGHREVSRSRPPSRPILAARIDRLRPRTSGCCRRPRSSARTSRSPCWRRIADDATRTALGAGSRACRRPSSSTRPSSFPELEYTFKHALTHEVAYGSLLQERRRALHARIVEAIERLLRGPAGRAGRGAGPARPRGRGLGESGRLPPPGGTYVFGRSANREAVRYLEQALGALHHLPRSREDGAGHRPAVLAPERALPLGDWDRIFAHLREAERLAARPGTTSGSAGRPPTSRTATGAAAPRTRRSRAGGARSSSAAPSAIQACQS